MRSITRAAGFRDMRPRLRQVLLGEDEEVTVEHRHLHHHEEDAIVNGESGEHQTLLPNHRQGASMSSDHHADERSPLTENRRASHTSNVEFAQLEPLRSKVQGAPLERIEELARQRDDTRAQTKDAQREPLLVAKVRRDDGTEAEVIVGQSTLPQTIFNSSNVLVGVGILSLPLGIKYAGWIIGLSGLFLSAIVSKHTAGLLAKCIDVDTSLANFADIAFVAFGEVGRVTTSSLISLELMVACVGLVILFADTLGSLIEGLSQVALKVLCGCILAPLQFLPMKWLAFTSFLGIFCNLLIILVAVIIGFLKAQSPGSLREVATTYAFPPQWKALPLSFGLIMGKYSCNYLRRYPLTLQPALWSGHSVFPNIYRDMRHPTKYASGLNYIFIFVVCLFRHFSEVKLKHFQASIDIAMAAIGYLMYGSDLLDEVSTNMIKTPEYSRAVKVFILVLVTVIPITKFPLQ